MYLLSYHWEGAEGSGRVRGTLKRRERAEKAVYMRKEQGGNAYLHKDVAVDRSVAVALPHCAQQI